jgi:hypothetical protein
MQISYQVTKTGYWEKQI